MKKKAFGCAFGFVFVLLLIAIAIAYPSCVIVTPEMKMKVKLADYRYLYTQLDDHRGHVGDAHINTNWFGNDLCLVFLKDDARELARRIANGLSPNSEYYVSGTFPQELGLPLLWFAMDLKAKRCARLLLECGASVSQPDGFNKIAIQWAEEAGMPKIADLVESMNTDTNLLVGLEITNAIKRLFPPGSLFIPPTNVPMVVVCEDERDFGKEMVKYAEAFPWPKPYSVLAVSTNGPCPVFAYQMRTDKGLGTFGGTISRHRGFYVITNSWICDH